MDARSTPAQDRLAAQGLPASMRADPRPVVAPSDDRKDPTRLDFTALMRRVEAEVYDIT
jgi:hypothetical protein